MPAPIEHILILDTETTALKPEEGELIEVGAILYSLRHRAIVSQLSLLLRASGNAAEGVNGIPPALLAEQTDAFQDAGLELLHAMAARADLYVAHNAAFDREWLDYHLGSYLYDRPWVCSMEDVDWPKLKSTKIGRASVTTLALAYGVPVWAAHRALTDCIYLAHVFDQEPALPELLEQAQEPKGLFKANVSYADRDLARQAGFQWDPDRKAWIRRLRIEDASVFPFPITYLQDA